MYSGELGEPVRRLHDLRPARRRAPCPCAGRRRLIDACEAMNRCASSDSDISSENSATAFLDSSAAFSAKLAISALLWTTMSSATKLWSPGTVRSYVSCSPADSIDATSSHHRSEVASSRARALGARRRARRELPTRHAPRADVPVVVARVPGGRADLRPRAVALGRDDLVPDLGGQACRRTSSGARARADARRRARAGACLPTTGDALGERVEALAAGDPHLARDRRVPS